KKRDRILGVRSMKSVDLRENMKIRMTQKGPVKYQKITAITGKFFIYCTLIIIAVCILYPTLSIVNVALKSTGDFYINPISLVTKPYFDNFRIAWHDANMSVYFFNSLFYTLAGSFLTAVFSLFVAYPIARKKIGAYAVLYIVFLI